VLAGGPSSNHYLLVLVTKTDGRETHARLVLLWPTSGALFAMSVHRFLPSLAKTQLGEALACVVSCCIKTFAWPTSIAFACGVLAFRAQLSARTCCGQLCWRLTETNCCKAVASLVLCWPARWALLSMGVLWFLSSFAKTQLSKTFTSVIACLIETFAWPAALVTLARWLCAFRANRFARACLWNLLWRLAEADCCKAHACLVFRWPTRRAFLPWSVHWLLARRAKIEMSKALARFIRRVIEAASRPARVITLARGFCAIRAQVLATAVRR